MAMAPCGASGRGEPAGPSLAGTVLPRSIAAPDFTLRDQTGAQFRMSSTRGKVVVVCFIYTHCTDVCPFIALKLKAARGMLGPDAGRTLLVAVTTDPERDTPEVLAEYSRTAGFGPGWHFVTGPLADVRKVWADYGVGVEIERSAGGHAEGHGHDGEGHAEEGGGAAPLPDPSAGLSPDARALAARIMEEFGGGYDVGHSTPFWFIDPAGMIRASLGAEAAPAQIAANMRTLAAGR